MSEYETKRQRRKLDWAANRKFRERKKRRIVKAMREFGREMAAKPTAKAVRAWLKKYKDWAIRAGARNSLMPEPPAASCLRALPRWWVR